MTPLLPKAIREEIVRQYRDDDRGKCLAGTVFYEEHVQPELIARTALEAMREPTEAMIAAFHDQFESGCNGHSMWNAMIDAALSEKN